MPAWTDYEWIPVERRLPNDEDGPRISSGAKVEVLVLTVEMMLNGKNPERRGFHVEKSSFDDDDEGKHRVMFWAPANGSEPDEHEIH